MQRENLPDRSRLDDYPPDEVVRFVNGPRDTEVAAIILHEEDNTISLNLWQNVEINFIGENSGLKSALLMTIWASDHPDKYDPQVNISPAPDIEDLSPDVYMEQYQLTDEGYLWVPTKPGRKDDTK